MLGLLLGQPLRPVSVFSFRSNPSEAKLPPDQKRILLAVGTFAAERGPIFAPHSHHGFTKPIADGLAKLLFDESPIPSRRPAFVARTFHRLPQIPGRVFGAVHGKNRVRVSHDFAPKHYPACMRLGRASFGLLCAFCIFRLHPAQFGGTFLRLQAVIDDRHEARCIRDEWLEALKQLSMISRVAVEQEHLGP